MNNGIRAINWNRIEDETDKIVWDKVWANTWIDTKIPLSGDVETWATMSEEEKTATKKVLGGLTLLDTVQSEIGIHSLLPYTITPHETAVLTQFMSMEAVHAKSYSSIFSTLCSMEEIDELYDWINSNKYLQFKKNIIAEHYESGDAIILRAASVALESMLFYSGFYLPMYWLSRKKLTNTADIIKLIIADESLHGYYIGYKFRKEFDKLTDEKKLEYFAKINHLFVSLYENEMKFISEVYDPIGLSDDVKKFVNYNFNKAFQNMGFEPKFSGEQINVSAAVMSALGKDTTHDFFSQGGNSYEVAVVEKMDFSDWGDMFGDD